MKKKNHKHAFELYETAHNLILGEEFPNTDIEIERTQLKEEIHNIKYNMANSLLVNHKSIPK
jgi:hypothetical protein